ncbi:hypothetical protein GCM10023189_11010 [Nibrella saemangeumensis]|uniref:Uncharacterized protein n=1 Tax=Nibrella saemangeumensis TaxID=1084526 RepID=A0ABP8MJ54_9BACT
MVYLTLFACKDHVPQREFIYGSRDLDVEGALDFVTRLVVEGWTVLYVSLRIDEGIDMELPVAAFDEQLMGEHLRMLQVQWEKILNLPQ